MPDIKAVPISAKNAIPSSLKGILFKFPGRSRKKDKFEKNSFFAGQMRQFNTGNSPVSQ